MVEENKATELEETEDSLDGCDCSAVDEADQTADEDLPAAVGGGS